MGAEAVSLEAWGRIGPEEEGGKVLIEYGGREELDILSTGSATCSGKPYQAPTHGDCMGNLAAWGPFPGCIQCLFPFSKPDSQLIQEWEESRVNAGSPALSTPELSTQNISPEYFE